MKKAFIIATTSDRILGLEKILSQIKFFYPEWYVSIVAQAYTDSEKEKITSKFNDEKFIFHFENELIGAHSAKVIAIKQCNADVYGSLDDDMEIIGITNYERIVEKLTSDNSAGIITSNWVKSETMIQGKKVEDKFCVARLVFTGGGLFFRKDIADIVLSIPNEQYLFDDCLWAIYSYINGYTNYRYMGSVAIHRICTKGGRRTWIAKGNKKVLPPKEILLVRKGTGKENGYNEYLICKDSDITEYSKELHLKNKK